MDIVVHSSTDKHVIKVLKYIIKQTLENKLKWYLLSRDYDEQKEIDYKRYNTHIYYIGPNKPALNVIIVIGKHSTSVDTMKDIKVKLFINYEDMESTDDISLIYSTAFYNTDKYTVETVESLLNQLTIILTLMRFDADEEKIIRDYIDEVIN